MVVCYGANLPTMDPLPQCPRVEPYWPQTITTTSFTIGPGVTERLEALEKQVAMLLDMVGQLLKRRAPAKKAKRR